MRSTQPNETNASTNQSYNDIVDRSNTNRTPLLEHYQNAGSLTRNG